MAQYLTKSKLRNRFRFLAKETGIVGFWVLLGTLTLFG